MNENLASPMLKRIGRVLCCGAVLAGCSSIMGPPEQRPPEKAPEPLPPVRQIIANSADTLFDATANARNVVIGELRRFDTAVGSEFGVCLRASVSDRGKNRGTVTYVLLVSRTRIVDRRKALPADGCDRETYQPL